VPYGIQTISHNSFVGRTEISRVHIPRSVTRVERGAFGGTPGMEISWTYNPYLRTSPWTSWGQFGHKITHVHANSPSITHIRDLSNMPRLEVVNIGPWVTSVSPGVLRGSPDTLG